MALNRTTVSICTDLKPFLMIFLSHSLPLPSCGLPCNGRVVVYFFIDIITVSHLHLPARRRLYRACCPWPTCRLQTACSSRGATASQKTTARWRATRTARRPARRAAEEDLAAATMSSGPTSGSRRNLGRAAVLRAWTTMMSRITWTPVSRIQIMVRANWVLSFLFHWNFLNTQEHLISVSVTGLLSGQMCHNLMLCAALKYCLNRLIADGSTIQFSGSNFERKKKRWW